MTTHTGRPAPSPLRSLAAVALMAAVISALAFITVPLGPVPLTGQSFGVMLAGALLGPRLGAVSVLAYLLLGLVGLPVFAGGNAGLGVLFGPTGGYLWGFVAGAAVIGLLTDVSKRPSAGQGQPAWQTFLGIALGGVVVVYVFGLWQLSRYVPFKKALVGGALLFLPGDLIKAAAATAVVRRDAVRRTMADYFAGGPTAPPED